MANQLTTASLESFDESELELLLEHFDFESEEQFVAVLDAALTRNMNTVNG